MIPEKGITWNEVTWYSRLLSIIFLLGVVPAVAFYIGVEYEKTKNEIALSVSIEQMPASAIRGVSKNSSTENIEDFSLIPTTLAAITPEYRDQQFPFDFHFSPNGHTVAYSVKKNNKFAMVINGQEGEWYDETDPDVVFSPDGNHVAYWAKDGGKEFVVLDRVAAAPYTHVSRNYFQFSADGKGLEYTASKDGKNWFVVMNGVEGKKLYGQEAEGILAQPTPDPTGTVHTVKEKGRWHVVSNNQAIPQDSEQEIYLKFTPDNKLYFDVVRTEEGQRKWHLIVDGKDVSGPYDYPFNLISSPKNEIAFSTKRGEKAVMVFRGKERFYDEIHYALGNFSADGQTLVFSARHGNKWYLIVGDREYGPYSSPVEYAEFTPNGRLLAEVYREGKEFLFDNGTEKGIGEEVDHVWLPIFSPSGKRSAVIKSRIYAKALSEFWIVLDGVEGEHYEPELDAPTFSPVSEKLVYKAPVDSGALTSVVIDTVESEPYYAVGDLHFSKDGKYLAYGAVAGDKIMWVVKNLK